MNRSISVPDDLDARVEKARGDVPRSVFWVRAMERALDGSRPNPVKPVSEEAPVAASGERIPSRPTPPRGQPKAERKAKAQDAMSAALARQQALNKPKGI